MRHTTRALLSLGLLATLLPLAACGGTDDISRTIGLTRDAPDEFVVTTRAPLSMPPDYNLRPPQPGAPRPQELSARDAAAAALTPQAALAPDASSSPGQQALLSAAGPAAPANIRDQINRTASLDTGDRTLTDRLMFWKSAPPPGVVVDPTRESQRIRENAALGQSPDVGDTAVIQRPSSGFLGNLF